MHDIKWSDAEKKIARRVFQDAVAAELAATIAEFKSRAAAVAEPLDMWALEQYLRERRRDIDEKYDYRYSQLIWVFARLLGEGRIQEADLVGLAEQKIAQIHHIASR